MHGDTRQDRVEALIPGRDCEALDEDVASGGGEEKTDETLRKLNLASSRGDWEGEGGGLQGLGCHSGHCHGSQ